MKNIKKKQDDKLQNIQKKQDDKLKNTQKEQDNILKNIKQLAIKNLEHLLKISIETFNSLIDKKCKTQDAQQISKLNTAIDQLKLRLYNHKKQIKYLLKLPDNCKFILNKSNCKTKKDTFSELFDKFQLNNNDSFKISKLNNKNHHEYNTEGINLNDQYKLIISYDELEYEYNNMTISSDKLKKKMGDRYEEEIKKIIIDQDKKKTPKVSQKLEPEILSDQLQTEYNNIKEAMEKLFKKDLKYNRDLTIKRQEIIIKTIDIDFNNRNQSLQKLQELYNELTNEIKKLNTTHKYYDYLLSYLLKDPIIQTIIEKQE